MFVPHAPVARCWIGLLPLALLVMTGTLPAEEPAREMLSAARRSAFEKEIRPLLVRTCGSCHGKEPKDNDLDLTRYLSAQEIIA